MSEICVVSGWEKTTLDIVDSASILCLERLCERQTASSEAVSDIHKYMLLGICLSGHRARRNILTD